MLDESLVDPELSPLLAQLGALSINAETLPLARAHSKLMAPPVRDETCDFEDVLIPGPEGAPDVRVLLIRPKGGLKDGRGLLHIHGGGFVLGTPELFLPGLQETAIELGCLIVSVDYRLAPETTFPGPLEDCYAALCWFKKTAVALKVDPDRIGLIGESAGAGLAAALTLLARDRAGPQVAFQNLMYPMLDDRTASVSADAGDDYFVWSRASNLFGWQSLLGKAPGGAEVSPLAAPGRATDLAQLPPAYIALGALDLFLAEDISYASRLMAAGVPLELHIYPGAFHGFDSDPAAAVSVRARTERMNALRRAFTSRNPK